MRIVDVNGFYTPRGGGVKTYVQRKLAAAPMLGHDVIILAPGDGDSDVRVNEFARIVTLDNPAFPLDRRYHYFGDEAALHRALERLQPDVVECSSPWTSPNMVARWGGAAVRSLVMHCDPLAAYPYRWFGGIMDRASIDRGFDWFWRHLRRLDSRYDIVISASPSLSSRLTGGGMTRVVTEPMGVEPHIFSADLRDDSLRADLLARCGLQPDATLLVGVGRFSPEKRWPMVIEAVIAAGYNRPVGLVLIGTGRDRGRMDKAAAGSPHIQTIAPIMDRQKLAALLASGDALIHGGDENETFCMVAAEARASGLPLIVPNVGGAADQADRGIGRTYRAGDAADLARAITAFLDEDPAAQLAAARARAPTVRTMDDHFRNLFGRYAALLEQRAAA